MPATTVTGTPIPTNADIGDSLADLLEAPRLSVARSPQEEDAWCYAACAQMVVNTLMPNNFLRQCEVATFVKNNLVTSCCPPTPEACLTSGCTVEQVGEILRNFHVDYEGSGNPEITINQITTSEIRSEIGDGHPIEVVIRWNTDGPVDSSHAVLITGIRDDDYVYITDPLRGINYNGWQPYEFVQNGFGEGRWVRTWTGLHQV